MGLSLQKGQSLSLTKSTGAQLSKIRLGLGWDAVIQKKGLFGRSKTSDVDLDASAIFFDANRQVLDTVYFGQLKSKDKSTQHLGDNLTGAGDGDDEVIKVDLDAVSPTVAQIVFVISSYQGQSFDAVSNAFTRVIDDSTGEELGRFQLSDAGSHTGMVMAKVARTGAGWSFQAIGERAFGKTAFDLAGAAAQSL